ncbi:hypothetical protein GC089_05550 [Cellulomonas sp. JZ18]|uniref:hypothetical protein n=1 Tax=Cellulomonas sp. JZ18 TaxID=2654191 RepID=UPI0012D42825|nr:hypothetical protein [Cellulomonas sp. JZ18]QGQ18811.1 hypothetical protein GC089_05550 [Cellulomonas sp. JZ18]
MTDAATAGGAGPIGQVTEGMDVVDAAGERVGTVASVAMGDPGAATGAGQDTGGTGGIVGAVVDAIVGPSDLPEQERERLLRVGYVRIDARGLFTGSRYAAADEIASVEGGTVHLGVPADRLVG